MRTIFFFFACFPVLLFGQKAVLLKQHNLSKWKVPGANYSGIANLKADAKAGESIPYAVISDIVANSGFYIFNIKQDKQTGDIIAVSPTPFVSGKTEDTKVNDYEGIAYVPQRNSLYISNEKDQSIKEFDLKGNHTGSSLEIPSEFGLESIYSNYGFEALTFDWQRKIFWTTTEHSLKKDGKLNANEPCLLRLQSFSLSGKPLQQYLYRTEAPEATTKARNYAFGVSAMTALPDGALLVLEREFFVAHNYIGSWVNHHIYEVRPSEKFALQQMNNVSEAPVLKKKLITTFKTSLSLFSQNLANYEGMCLGPKLADGRQTVILISDSQNNYGNKLYRMKDYIKVMIL